MANLYSGIIKCNGNYVDVSTETGVEFENGHDYQIQFFNKGYIREGEEGTGFRVYEGLPVTIKYQGISNNCVTGIFYLNSLDLSIRNSSTDVVSTIDIITGALITGIDTTYLAVDSQGRLTLSATVIAKLNSIT